MTLKPSDMKKMNHWRERFLVTGSHILRLAGTMFQPLKNMPTLDFNNQYDSCIL